MQKPTKPARYAYAIRWIAHNDEPTERDPKRIADLISVLLVADLFGIYENEVAEDVAAERERITQSEVELSHHVV